jgi:GNAT superfamily N-acetyltransferase
MHFNAARQKKKIRNSKFGGMAMVIEKALVSDAEEILSLQKLSYISEAKIYDDFNIPPLHQSLEQVKSEFGSHVFLKALVDGKITGSVRASADNGVCTVFKLIVHPDFQNRGIGTSLVKEIEKVFSYCKRFEIFTGHKSERNLYLYQKLGYRIFKREKLTDKVDMVYLAKQGSGVSCHGVPVITERTI